MKRFFLFIIGICLICIAFAQEGKEIQLYRQAEESYKIGHFDEAVKLLLDNIDTFSGRTKETVFRLLALCYLEEDKNIEAEKYVTMLLKNNPYYTVSISDPLRFVDMIERMKKGKVTITTASQQAETLDEAPVAVTLITEEMISAIGARTLKDVLIAYVPGVTSVESPNEVNVAMHGVYSAGQEKILIMLNGQRMNARSTNKAAPDYSISLEKIKQIEVLRGPASSLYGNVALMAVVNMITKEGKDVDGANCSISFGNFGQKKANLLVGKRFMDTDFMAWASFYTSKGQKRFVPKEFAVGANPHDGYAWTEAYNHLPSYDFGFTFKRNQLTLNFNQRYGKKVPTFADIHTSMGALYDYEKYKLFNGEGPGHGMSFTHAGISYSNQIKDLTIDVNTYFDLNKSSLYSLIGDEESGTTDSIQRYSFFQIMNWSEFSIGGNLLVNYNYPQLKRFGKGNILAGIQVEYMKLYGSEGLVGHNYTDVFNYWPTPPVQLGSESTYSPFFQLKHSISEQWIINAGVRYDIKRRANKKLVTSLSPRVSLIYLPSPKIDMKLNYARSFVDAPYFYRFNQSPSYKGPEDMRPEYMEAIQGSISYQPISSVNLNSVLFYNNLSGLIYRDQSATGNDPRYINAGSLQLVGWENSVQYQIPRLMCNFNMTYQRALSGENYSVSGYQIHNIPNWFMNIVLNANLFKQSTHEFWLYTNGKFTGKQLSPIDKVIIGGNLVEDWHNELPANFIMNAGVKYCFKNIEFSLSCYNLWNKTYYQGGSTPIPYIQQGFSFIGTLKYNIK